MVVIGVQVVIYIHLHACLYMYMNVHIYRERERARWICIAFPYGSLPIASCRTRNIHPACEMLLAQAQLAILGIKRLAFPGRSPGGWNPDEGRMARSALLPPDGGGP